METVFWVGWNEFLSLYKVVKNKKHSALARKEERAPTRVQLEPATIMIS